MEKLDTHTSKAAWRSRLERHAQSGKSIAGFCRDETVSKASFHIWRAKLAAANEHAAGLAQPAAFIDLGAIKDTASVTSIARPPASAPTPSAGIDVRIENGRTCMSWADGVHAPRYDYLSAIITSRRELVDCAVCDSERSRLSREKEKQGYDHAVISITPLIHEGHPC